MIIQGNFVEVNCATLQGETSISTLLGHTKGAFTGAQQSRWLQSTPQTKLELCESISDLFDQLQLHSVLGVCRHYAQLSAAGRTLFNQSRLAKSSSNDADRLRKNPARFGLTWESLKAADRVVGLTIDLS